MNTLVKNGSYYGVTILRTEDLTGENLFAKKSLKIWLKLSKISAQLDNDNFYLLVPLIQIRNIYGL